MNDRAVDASELAGTLERLLRDEPVHGLVSAYLFGSHAAGRAHRESDVDLGVLLNRRVHATREARFSERVRLTAWAIGALHRNEVDVVVLNDAPPGLGRRIVTTGRRLYCCDAEVDHAFVRDVQLRAADLEPFLRRARRIKLDALPR
jgi:predicted nucleotidyltransferase